MQFTVLIPARMASTRLPGKPLADIDGIPMVVRVAKQALQSQAAQVVVAADCMEIIEVCARYGVQAILTRPDHLSGSDRLAEACLLLNLPDDTVVVNVQGDEPLAAPGLMNSVAKMLLDRPDCAMATAACAIAWESTDFANPNVVKVVLDARQKALYFSRCSMPFQRGNAGIPSLTDSSPLLALRHLGIYSYRARFIQDFANLPASPLELAESLEQLRALWHGFGIAVHITASEPGPSVDTLADLANVRAIMQGRHGF